MKMKNFAFYLKARITWGMSGLPLSQDPQVFHGVESIKPSNVALRYVCYLLPRKIVVKVSKVVATQLSLSFAGRRVLAGL